MRELLLLLAMLDQPGPKSVPSPKTPSARTTHLYISATMHIETNRLSWPDPDRLIAFSRRATAAGKTEGRSKGMRWSIGADIGWLDGERRAGEVIKALEELGVEWDIHAHQLRDRANCFAAITKLGGHPNKVASGMLVAELDMIRDKIKGREGAIWQAEVLWGVALHPLHGPGADDNAVGLWRPRSSREWSIHDPRGSLIAVGGGTRKLEDAENMAKQLDAGGDRPPVVSTSIMVSPRTLTIIGTKDGIDAIEAWAGQVAALSVVEWATIRETAAAWLEAAGVVSREEK